MGYGDHLERSAYTQSRSKHSYQVPDAAFLNHSIGLDEGQWMVLNEVLEAVKTLPRCMVDQNQCERTETFSACPISKVTYILLPKPGYF